VLYGLIVYGIMNHVSALAAEYLVALGIGALLSALFWIVERRQSRGSYLANYLYFPFYLAWVYALQSAAAPLLSRVVMTARGGLLSRIVAPYPGLLTEIVVTVLFAVIWDVWQYWVHRWQHASPILWQSHKLHHSDAALNSSTQARHHPLNYVVNLACYAPMLLLFGSLAPHAVAAFFMFRVWGFVNHANVRISFGPLTGLIAGPQWHRIHHSIAPEHIDRNFATFFPFIDRLFGTYYAPAGDEYPPTGLVSGEHEPFLRQATISPFIAWYRDLTDARL